MQFTTRIYLSVCVFFIVATGLSKNTYDVIPLPSHLEEHTGEFHIDNKTRFLVSFKDKEQKRIAGVFVQQVFRSSGIYISVLNKDSFLPTTDYILFKLDTPTVSALNQREAYRMEVEKDKINLSSSGEEGFYYAIQTLLQLMPAEVFSPIKVQGNIHWIVPCCSIEDAPRYIYRGMQLDVCRHFFPVSFIKKYLDLMALHKMNTFHWHLTEDQGWRIEIKKYPRLTIIGSKRKETLIGHAATVPEKYDGKEYSGFYTQAEIKEIVSYARDRFITIIPEIELPGHSLAALAAYPELACTSGPFEVACKWGVFTDVYCPTEKTFEFLDNVLQEVIDLFPGTYIHIGGDECPKESWKKSAFCQQLIKNQSLKNEHELQSYFIKRIEQFLSSKGRKLIGWDEILEGGLSPQATVMSWRGTAGGLEAAREGHDVIMTPSAYCYFDHYQADPKKEPLAIGGYTDLEKVYQFEPTPDSLNAEQAKHILGAQGNVWTEYMLNGKQVEHMVFPRACALSEVVWSPKQERNLASFTERMKQHYRRLEYLDVNAARKTDNAAISSPTKQPEKQER